LEAVALVVQAQVVVFLMEVQAIILLFQEQYLLLQLEAAAQEQREILVLQVVQEEAAAKQVILLVALVQAPLAVLALAVKDLLVDNQVEGEEKAELVEILAERAEQALLF
jgi:hypothetical protein